jgi:phosphatidylglycerophosphatase C
MSGNEATSGGGPASSGGAARGGAGSGGAGSGGGERAVAVFDLDGTLLRGDSFARFLVRLLLRNPYRAVATTAAAPVLGTMLFLPAVRRYGVAGLLWLATVGLPPGRFDALLEEFAAGHAAESNRISVTLERLHAHLDAGDRVVIATGCPAPMATALCHALGLEAVEIVGARLVQGKNFIRPLGECRMWNALPTATRGASFGAEKVRRLTAAGISTPVAYVYTDSASDIPLLLAAAHQYLVDPAPGHLRRVRARAGLECAVLRSRPGGPPVSPD